MTTINEDIDLPGVEEDFTTPIFITVAVVGENSREIRAFHPSTGVTLVSPNRFRLNSNTTTWSLDLLPNEELVPEGTVYKRTITVGTRFSQEDLFLVPPTGGPFTVEELLTEEPATLESSSLQSHSLQVEEEEQGVHGVVRHNWERDGWDPFTALPITIDGDQEFETTSADGRGRVTGLNPGDGNHRIAYVRSGTRFADSEMRSLIWGPTADWTGANAQQGHMHRIRQIAENMWESIDFWTSVVFGGQYNHINVAAHRFDGTTAVNSSEGISGTFGSNDATRAIDRRALVVGRERIDFGGFLDTFHYTPAHFLSHLEIGDEVAIEGMDDVSFEQAAVDVSQIIHPRGQLTVPNEYGGTTVAWSGTVASNAFLTPTSLRQKRWVPFWMATRVLGGDENAVPVEMKRWRLGEPEPDWGDPRVQRDTLLPNEDVPALPVGPGDHALWNAHYFDGSGAEWGEIEVRSLD